jgi:hypothetical protein
VLALGAILLDCLVAFAAHCSGPVLLRQQSLWHLRVLPACLAAGAGAVYSARSARMARPACWHATPWSTGCTLTSEQQHPVPAVPAAVCLVCTSAVQCCHAVTAYCELMEREAGILTNPGWLLEVTLLT